MDEELLREIGLTNGEVNVYLALLELGSSTVGPISKKSGVAYSNIYDVLQRLKQKGLVTYVTKSKTKHFQALEPYSIKQYLDKQEQEIQQQKERIDDILPKLRDLRAAHDTQDAEVFVGTQGLRTAYERLIHDDNRLDFIFYYEEAYVERANTFYNRLMPTFREKQLKLRGVSQEAYKTTEPFKEHDFISIRYVDSPVASNVDIVNDKILLITWSNPTGILIQSHDIAQHYQRYFNTLWDKAQ